MKLGFYYHLPVYNTLDGVFIPGYLGLFIDELAKNVETLVLFAHTTHDYNAVENDYKLQSKNIILIDLGKKKSFPYRVLFGYRLIRKIDNVDCDAILVRAPSPLAPCFFRFNKQGIKIIYLLVGDYVKSIKEFAMPFLQKLPRLLLFQYNSLLQNQVIKKSLVFVNSEALYLKYKKIALQIEKTKTTTLRESDFYLRTDTCQNDSINILYTGRFDLAKGMEELIQAVNLISHKNIKIHFVGWEWNNNPDKPVEKYLTEIALNLGVEVVFHGKKKVGKELNMMYRMADIYAMPSYQEGFPRTIWEAMANSCPVIATKVGSIPYYLKDNESALLIEPKKNIVQLKDAIEMLIKDKELRKKLINNAYNLVQDNTVEHQTQLIIDKINDYVE